MSQAGESARGESAARGDFACSTVASCVTVTLMAYTKLFRSLVHSSIWQAPDHIRLVWVTLLALADRDSTAQCSVPGLAAAARVTREQADEALMVLSSADPDSTDPTYDGRRIERTETGFRLLNHARYSRLMSEEDKREKAAERQKRWRDRNAKVSTRRDVTRDVTPVTDVTPLDQTRPDHLRSRAAAAVSPKPKKWRRVPSLWVPSAQHEEIARARGLDFDLELASFRDYEFGTAKSDADAAFRNWLRKARPGGGRPRAPDRDPTPSELFARVERLRAAE